MYLQEVEGEHAKKQRDLGINHLIFGKEVNKEGRIRYGMIVKVVDQPTNNCQLTSIASMCNIVCNNSYSVDDVVAILRKISENYLDTRCVLVDIPVGGLQKYKDALAKMGIEILVEAKYTNPTGSEMVFVYANYAGDCDEDDDDEWDDDEYYDEDDDESEW